MRTIVMTLGVWLAVTLNASAQSVDAALAARDKEFTAAVKEKNLGKVVAFYADDAVMYGDGTPVIKGRAAIQQMWQAGLSEGSVLTMTTKVVDAQVGANLAYSYGTFAYPPSGGNPGRTGNTLQVWKKVGNQWLIAYDTFSNGPAPPPQKK